MMSLATSNMKTMSKFEQPKPRNFLKEKKNQKHIYKYFIASLTYKYYMYVLINNNRP